MTNSIYDQHDKAFNQVQAYITFKIVDGVPHNIAKIAFKFPKDGAGRLWCYVHVLGTPMARGNANGYGYDKRSAAITIAANNIPYDKGSKDEAEIVALQQALFNCESKGFDRALRDAGYVLLQAV